MASKSKAKKATPDGNGLVDDRFVINKITIKTDPKIPEDRFIFEGIDVSREPLFSISEVAKVFFGKSDHWVRWVESKGFLEIDGVQIEIPRTDAPRKKNGTFGEGSRIYSLATIELMGHALARKDRITGEQLQNLLIVVATEARIWGYL